MYPINLENQYEKYFKSMFKMICDNVLGSLLPELKKNLPDNKIDSLRMDSSSDLLSFIENLRHKYGDFISDKKLSAEIAQNFNLIDEWSRSKTTAAIQKMYSRLNTPQLPGVTGRPAPDGVPGELWGTPVNLKKSITSSLIDKTVSSNVSLIKTAGREFFDDIADTVKNGISSGESYDDIKNTIMDRTGAHASRAQFWARDQVGKFFGDVTKMRQEGAGIPGFIWRTMEDGDVRDSHRFLEGTYHRWDNLPAIPRTTKGGGYFLVKLYPGKDFHCRCFAEPALGPEAADREYRAGAENFSTPDVKSGNEFTPANWGGDGILKRVIIDTDNIELKDDINKTLGAIDRLLKIDTGKARALTITSIAKSDPLSADVFGYHYYSGHIAVNPGSPFKQQTIVHEFFHWIDMKVLPKSGREAYNRIIDGIKKTAYYKELSFYKKHARDSITRSHIEYLMTPSELFARSMEQYVSKSGVDAGLSNQFLEKKKQFEKYYWFDDDFNNVYLLIENMFKGLGWK